MSDDADVEIYSENESSNEPSTKEVETSQIETSSIGSGNFNCPFEILKKWAKGPCDPKSPLKQFVSNVPTQLGTTGCTRKWKCNLCNLESFGNITRTNSHFLLVQGKGIGVCQKVNKNLKYKDEMLKLWGCNEDCKESRVWKTPS